MRMGTYRGVSLVSRAHPISVRAIVGTLDEYPAPR